MTGITSESSKQKETIPNIRTERNKNTFRLTATVAVLLSIENKIFQATVAVKRKSQAVLGLVFCR